MNINNDKDINKNKFSINYNNYIITNPYFLSLYSAFKIVLNNILNRTINERKYYDCGWYDEKDLIEVDKNIEILKSIVSNLKLEYEIEYNDKYYLTDAEVKFNINNDIITFKNYGLDGLYWYSINEYEFTNSYNVIVLKDIKDEYEINKNKNKDTKHKVSRSVSPPRLSANVGAQRSKNENDKDINKEIKDNEVNNENNKNINNKLLKIINFLEIITPHDFKDILNKPSINIIKSMLESIFNLTFSGSNTVNFIYDIINISDDELIDMLCALLNIH